MAERHMLRRLFAGCLAPVGAKTSVAAGALTLEGVVLSTDGKTIVKASSTLPMTDYQSLGVQVAEELIANGADRLLSTTK